MMYKTTDFHTCRMSLRLTQEEMGEKIGRTTRTIQRYESGKAHVPPLVMKAVRDMVSSRICDCGARDGYGKCECDDK